MKIFHGQIKRLQNVVSTSYYYYNVCLISFFQQVNLTLNAHNGEIPHLFKYNSDGCSDLYRNNVVTMQVLLMKSYSFQTPKRPLL
jgi:hypothetical protein